MYKSNILESTGDFNDFIKSNLSLRSSEAKKYSKTSSVDILSLNGQAAVFTNDRIKNNQKILRNSKESTSKLSSSLTPGPGKQRESLTFRNRCSPIRSSQQDSTCKHIDPIIGVLEEENNFPHFVHSWRRHIPQQDPATKELKSTHDRYAHIIQRSINHSINLENLICGKHDRIARVFALWRDGFKERSVYRTEAMHRAMILRSYHLLTSSFQTWFALSKAVRFEQVRCYYVNRRY